MFVHVMLLETKWNENFQFNTASWLWMMKVLCYFSSIVRWFSWSLEWTRLPMHLFYLSPPLAMGRRYHPRLLLLWVQQWFLCARKLFLCYTYTALLPSEDAACFHHFSNFNGAEQWFPKAVIASDCCLQPGSSRRTAGFCYYRSLPICHRPRSQRPRSAPRFLMIA